MVEIEPAPEEIGTSGATARQIARGTPVPDPVFTMKALQDLSERIHGADSLDSLIDSIVEGLELSFGFKNSMILVPTEGEGVLVTLATRGYAQNGAGAEVWCSRATCRIASTRRTRR